MKRKQPESKQRAHPYRSALALREIAAARREPSFNYPRAPRAPAGEMKYFDCDANITLAAVTTSWVAGTRCDPTTTINLGDPAVALPLCLFAPIVSANLNGRIGRKVKMLKVKVRGMINVPKQSVAATSDDGAECRILLVLDTQTNIAQMVAADLLNNATQAITTINSYQNPNNFGRFRVLKDKILHLNSAALTGAATVIEQAGFQVPFKINFVFKGGLAVNFNATVDGTVAMIIDNSLHLIAGVNTTTLAPVIAYYSRVCYKE